VRRPEANSKDYGFAIARHQVPGRGIRRGRLGKNTEQDVTGRNTPYEELGVRGRRHGNVEKTTGGIER